MLSRLIGQGYIAQKQGAQDRRQRLLHLTDKGIELERQLSRPQQARVARAYRQAGAEAVAGYRQVLLGLINEAERAKVLESIMNP